MPKPNSNAGINLLFGLTFLSPVTYSLAAYEMDVVQRMFFIITSLLLFLVFVSRFKSEKTVQFNKILSVMILLFPVTFLTAILNKTTSLLLLNYSDIIIPFSIILQSALLLTILGEDKFFKVVSYSVVIISTSFSIIGVLEVFQIKTLQLPEVKPPGSVLGHRSFAAEFLLTSIPFFLIVKDYLKKDGKPVLLIAAIINVSFLLFTRNRSGILILIAVMVLYLVFTLIKEEKVNKLKSIMPVIIVFVCSFLISLIPVKGVERPELESAATTIFDTDYKSNLLRLNFWDASLQMIKEYPVKGVGIYKWSGIYPKYYGDYFNDINLTYVHNVHAHNDFLELAAESGIIASLVFLLIYILVSLSLFKKIKQNEKYFPILLTFLITFAFSLTSFPNHKFSSFFLAAVVAGTSLVVPNEKDKLTVVSLKFSHLKLALFVVFIFGGITSYIRLKSEITYGEAIFLKDRKQYPLMLEKLNAVSAVFYPLDASKQPIDYYRGIAYYYLGRTSEALKSNLSANDLAPFNPIIIRNLAGLYQLQNNKKKAIELYEKIEEYFPNYIDAQINLLNLYAETKQTEKEKKLFDKLIKKSPENPRLVEYKSKIQLQ